jgi:hypothetical protein
MSPKAVDPDHSAQSKLIAGTTIAGVRRDWTYEPSSPSWGIRYRRFKVMLRGRSPRPPHCIIREVTPESVWVVYFMYCPSGVAEPRHEYTLSRLREEGLSVLCVCATPSPEIVPDAAKMLSSALAWKGLGGYDFSAYRLGLELVSEYSSGARVLCLNDSMFGPFSSVRPLIEEAPWDLTGLTASALHENHIQSYAFVFSKIDRKRLEQLDAVLFPNAAYEDVEAVILNQENRLARIASEHMSVGAYWYSDGSVIKDICLQRPLQLIDAGFPFLKRSLLGKMSHFQERGVIADRLRKLGFPLV